jgi:hypothetical protein
MTVIAQTMIWGLDVMPRPVPVAATVMWDEANPLEVSFDFNVGLDEPVRWVFARDLLLDAIQKNKAGEADVQCEVRDDHMTMRLESPFGTAQFSIEASIVGQFLARTLGKVPRGEENYDLDTVIAQFFAEPA